MKCADAGTCSLWTPATNEVKNFAYTGGSQGIVLMKAGRYKIELWGASGGSTTSPASQTSKGGLGGYVSGTTTISANTDLYVYVGGGGDGGRTDANRKCVYSPTIKRTFNGGGDGNAITYSDGTIPNIGCAIQRTDEDYVSGSGGGATDVRTVIRDEYSNNDSLRSRLIVAAGGGSSSRYGGGSQNGTGGSGGGLTGYDGTSTAPATWPNGVGRNQTAAVNYGGRFGLGGGASDAGTYHFVSVSSGGGGGWYGGGATYHVTGSGGGSSYISGHTGSVAVTSTSSSSPKSGCTTGTTNNACSISPYGYTFTDTVMIDGAGYKWTNVKGSLQQMPNPSGGNYASGVGHSGNGYARITYLGT